VVEETSASLQLTVTSYANLGSYDPFQGFLSPCAVARGGRTWQAGNLGL
jgi:hypothetical protein